MNALRDATLQGAFLGRTEDILKDKNGSKKAKKTKDLVRKFAIDLTGMNVVVDDDYVYTLISNVVKNAPSSIDKNGNAVSFTYGNAQKLINMTAKYLYIRNYSNPQLAASFKHCHCPLDNQIVKKLKSDAKRGSDLDKSIKKLYSAVNNSEQTKTWRQYLDLPWSSCTKERYQFFQKAIRETIEKKYNNEITPLEYDYVMWNS